jgi:hypothetical protein
MAPSEVPSISSQEASSFGNIAEDLIYADFMRKYMFQLSDIYIDGHNPGPYIMFLQSRNPQIVGFTEELRYSASFLGLKRPDILVHTALEKAYYEIKPDSADGWSKGQLKLGTIGALFIRLKLPYRRGTKYRGCDLVVGQYKDVIAIRLRARLVGDGLIVYKLCLESNVNLEPVVLAALFAFLVRKLNQTKGGRSFRPIDLETAFASEGQLAALAKALQFAAIGAVAAVSWRFFWKAVVKRFAVRGALALTLAGIDGPLPVGDLVAAGMSILMIIDVIRFHDELWADARRIASEET